MNKVEVEFDIWLTTSIVLCCFIAFVEFVLSWAIMFELHMNSTSPGDFAFTSRSIILTDIAVYLGVLFLINLAIVYVWSIQTKRMFGPSASNQRFFHRITLAICVAGALILNGHLIYSAMHYWQERTPFFTYKPSSS